MSADSIAATITKWLIEKKWTDSSDPRVFFTDLGLDSIGSVELAVFLEKELELELDETIVYSYPSVQSLAGHLAKQMPSSRESAPDRGSDTGDETSGAASYW